MPIDFLLNTKSRKERALVLILAAFTCAVASWAVPFGYPKAGLDPSWAQALVDATDKGRVFGKDIIFTFGPLHQAVTAQISTNLTSLVISRFAFSLIWFVVQASIGLFIGWQAEASIALGVAISAGQHGDTIFYLLALVGIVAPAAAKLRLHGDSSVQRIFLSTVIVSGSLLATLVKLSYVGALLPVLMLVLGLQLMEIWDKRNTRSLVQLALLILCPAFILFIAWGLTSGWSLYDLYAYYFGANLQIIKGYTDAMSYGPSVKSLLLVLVYVSTFLVLLFLANTLFLGASGIKGITRVAHKPLNLLTLGCLIILAWVVFKSAFVRDDSGHILLAALWLISFYFIIIGFSMQKLKKSLLGENGEYVALSLLMPFVLSSALGLLSGYRPAPGIILGYTRGFFGTFRLLSPKGQLQLSQQRMLALDKIRKAAEDYRIPKGDSADVIPWDISYVLASGLKYTPRPIPQSYAVYTQYLQDINKKFYTTPGQAPSWLIVDIKDIDGRLPIGLDSPVLASISNGYQFSHRGSKGSLVFRQMNKTYQGPRRGAKDCKDVYKGRLSWHRTGKLSWSSEVLPIPRSGTGFSMFTAEFGDSLSRSVLSSLYRPFPVSIEYLNESGDVLAAYRFIPKASREVIVHPIVSNNEDFLEVLLQADAGSDGVNGQVSSFRFVTRNLGVPFSRLTYELSSGCGRS